MMKKKGIILTVFLPAALILTALLNRKPPQETKAEIRKTADLVYFENTDNFPEDAIAHIFLRHAQ